MPLMINKASVHCDLPVRDMAQHGMSFKPGHGARVRDVKKTTLDLFVIHWTGGEGNARGCFDVLNARELGVEFCIDRPGEIWQFADPVLVDTYDAGSVNPRSMGVEVSSYGYRKSVDDIPRLGLDREVYETTVRGRKLKCADFYAAQTRALIALVDGCTAAVSTIPRLIPGTTDGRLLQRTMTRKELQNFKGVLGHFHISDNKLDPGTRPFEALLATGRYKLAPVGPA